MDSYARPLRWATLLLGWLAVVSGCVGSPPDIGTQANGPLGTSNPPQGAPAGVTLDTKSQTWRGDFSSGDLTQFHTFQCGGPGSTCPGGKHGEFLTDDLSPSALSHCTTSDPAGCRFQLVSPPPMAASGVALRVNVVSDGAPGAGDYDPGFHGPRNELVNSRETAGKIAYTEGDERYFAWQTFFPDGSTPGEGNFPDPPRFCTDPSCAPSGFNVFFQLHQEGVCGGPPISLGLVRADTVNPSTGYASQNTGNVYHMVFNVTDGVYTGDTPRLWPPMGHTEGMSKGGWYSFILHVRWAKTPCQGACNSPKTFNQGVVELWVKEPGADWQYAWPGHGKSAAHATTYDWPASSQVCSADPPGVPRTGSMPQNLKLGLYRDALLRNTATVYHQGSLAGTTCEAVNLGGCPPR